MATTAKRKDLSPGAGLLIVGLLAALAAGGGLHIAGGGNSSSGHGSSFRDPCDGQDPYHLLEEWTASDGKQARLRCDRWRHILQRHPVRGASSHDILACVGSTVENGTWNQAQSRYEWTWGPGSLAAVVVEAGRVITAYPGAGGWDGCAGAR